MSGIRVAVAGAKGRMGEALLGAIAGRPEFALSGILARGDDPATVLTGTDVLIEFTDAVAAAGLAQAAARTHVALVSGSTGLSQADEAKIRDAAKVIPVVRSANMSLGVTVLAALVKEAARALPQFDIEILEMHHREKKDAPSGTARLLGEAAAQARGIAPVETHLRAPGPRRHGEIGFAALRGGSVTGEHEVILAGPAERLSLKHSAEYRSIFANGALSAAQWVMRRPAGLYSMADVLGL